MCGGTLRSPSTMLRSRITSVYSAMATISGLSLVIPNTGASTMNKVTDGIA